MAKRRVPEPIHFGSKEPARAWFKGANKRACEVCGWHTPIVPWHSDSLFGLEVHHIKPRCNGGGYQLANLALLCRNCHCVSEAICGGATIPENRDGFLREIRLAILQPKKWCDDVDAGLRPGVSFKPYGDQRTWNQASESSSGGGEK